MFAPAVPLSPASPPDSGFKPSQKRRYPSDTPDSPVSPPLMSVATKRYISSYENAQSQEDGGRRSKSPNPSSSSLPSQHTSQSQRTPSSFTTQSNSIARSPRSSMQEDVDQHRDKRQKVESGYVAGRDAMNLDNAALPSDHDRHVESQGQELDHKTRNVTKVESPGKEGLNGVNLEDELGEDFLLCKSTVPRSRPDPSQHLLAIYGLTPLLKTVARTDPQTGEKINKLRKSYEGQIKGFDLSGRNKPVKSERDIENDMPGPLRRIAETPDEQWEASHSQNIDVSPDFASKLRLAVQLQPGTVRNVAHWDDIIGHEKSRLPIPQPQSVHHTTTVAPHRVPNGINRPPHNGSIEKRATRGKKRSYDDDSFVGYGDGYSDVEGESPGGYDDEDGHPKRKRKKVNIANTISHLPANVSQQSISGPGLSYQYLNR